MPSNALSPLPLTELATGLTPAEPLAWAESVISPRLSTAMIVSVASQTISDRQHLRLSLSSRCRCAIDVEPAGHATDAAASQQDTNGDGDGIVTVIRQRHDAR